ncbi:hypothetical protein [Halopiger aswanensis]|uniref:Trichohyalin n=1 Tax=Halopiger aswanensis TaxID=148449 RepID=A0A3R7FWA6_9EURY|nr:hypothetical protein [Halopiger aswanensis]RKD95620.1 trichohyalin [Halopiger aswanensis]
MVYEDYTGLLESADPVPQFTSGNEGYPSKQEIDRLLSEAYREERERVETLLKEIEGQIQERTGLHEDLIHELEQELERYEENLQKLLRQFGSGSREKKAHQKQRIQELKQEIREEQQRHWHDRQKLLAERREARRELDALDDNLLTSLL